MKTNRLFLKFSTKRNQKNAAAKNARARKPSALAGSVALLAAAALSFGAVSKASAATYWWDATGDNDSTIGGTATWNTTNAFWDLLGTDLAADNIAWPNLATDVAVFSSAFSVIPVVNTVTLVPGITANQLAFYRSGYTLTGGDLTLAGTAPGLYAQMGETATISSQILGSAGLTKTGGGSIRLTNAANGYTGTTTIANGSLIINSAAALGGTGAVNITTTNNTPLNNSMIGLGGGALVLDGTAGGFTFARDVNFEGRGPLGDRSAAILSIGSNTLSGTLNSAVSPLPLSPTASIRNSRIISVNGTLTYSGTLNSGGTSAATFLNLGGLNSAGVGDHSITGALTGTGSIEKSGSGTLFLNPSATSGFSGTVRISGSATGQQSTVRVTQLTVGGTSIFGANTVSASASSVIDMNGGVLEFRNDGSLDFNSLASGKNVYLRANSTFYTGPAVGGAGINGVTTLGTYRQNANVTGTFNSRNGYGMTLQAWSQEAVNNANTITNNLGGTLTFTADIWPNTDTTARTLTFNGNGNTRVVGSVTATVATAAKTLTKQGTGELIINGVASTLTGQVNVEGGAVRVTDFRSLNNNTVAISLGNATTTAGNLIIGGTGTSTGTAAGLISTKPIILNGTTASSSIYANQAGANPVTLNGAITKIAAATTGALILGGTSTVDNIINVVIPVETTASTGGLTKLGAGTWVLNAANTYLGATSIQEGTLKLRATAAASDVIKETATNTVVFTSNATTGSAGGILEFRGFSGAATTETLGALTSTAGAATVRLLGNGAAANLTFTSLGATTGASSLNFDTSAATGGVVTLTGQVATTATNLPGTALFQGHLYANNGADFATTTAAGVVQAPTYVAAGPIFSNASTALVAAVHNKLTGSFTNAAATVSSLVTNNQTLTLSGNLVVSTGGILQSGGTASILSDSATSRLIQGAGATTNVAIRVNLSTDVLNLGSATNPVNISSVTTAGLTKNGAGTLNIAGVNAQTGTTTINEGTVRLLGASARLSATTASLVIRQNAVLQLDGHAPSVARVNALDGAGTITNVNASSAVFQQDGGGTWNGIFANGAGVLGINKGGGAATWSGLNTYTGVTTIQGTGLVTVDTLALGGFASGIGASTSAASNLVFAGSTAGIDYRGSILDGALTLGSRSATTDRLFTLAAAATGVNLSSSASNNNAIIWSNTGAIVNNTTANALLTLTGAGLGDNTFNPQITDSSVGGIVLGLTKSGAGQWNLGAASNIYTGVTTLNEGILALNNNGALATNSPLVLAPTSATSPAILQMSGTFDRNLTATPTVGTGAVNFGGAVASTTGGVGFAAHATPLIVAIGGVGAPTALTWGSGGFIGTGAVQNLVLNSTTALSSVDFRNPIDLGALVRTINVLDNGNTGADYAMMSGNLTGAGGGLLKIGSGILSLTGASGYTGTTTVEAGTLIVTSLGSSTGAGTSSVGAGGVAMTNANAVVLGNATTTGGILQYVGPGETSDRKIRLRGTTASNQIHADGSGALILTNVAHDTTETGAKTLFLRGTNTANNMITSQLSDNGTGALSITVDGGASWILTSPLNNFTGAITAGSGGLGIGDNAALGVAGTLVNNNGNVFAYGADRTIANNVTLSNNATNGWLGDYSLTINSVTNLAAGANNVNTNNSIVAGKALVFNGGVTANALTANRAWVLDGPGETVVNGSFTTSTAFGVRFDINGGGTLTLGTNGATSNFNQSITAVDVDRGTLKFTANNAIPTLAAANGGVTLSPELATGDTARFDLNGTNQTINALAATTDGTVIIDNTSATAASFTFGANNTAVTFGTGVGSYSINNSGSGALSITKTGNTTATFGSTLTLAHKGMTASDGGGIFNIAAPVTATTGLKAVTASTLSLTGAITNPSLITSVEVGGGSTLGLINGAGSKLNVNTLSLGNTGTGTVTLNFNIGDITSGDGLNTDTITLLTGGALNLGNTITFNMTDAGMNAGQTYTLLNVVDGGLTAYGFANLIQGATPGGFASYTWNTTNNTVSLTLGTLITGSSWWNANGALDNWTDINNWAKTDKSGATIADSVPGAGTDVIFIADNIVGGAAITTTLEGNFKINSLTFEASTNPANTPASVTVAPGAVSTNRLEVAPQLSTDGVRITAGGPASVIISAPFKIGAAQTWTVADAASTLTLSAALMGEADVAKTGSGKVIISAASDSTFNSGNTTDFTINGGALEIQNVGSLGTIANGNLARVAVNSTGAFYYNGAAGTVANNLTLGGGTLSAGTANQIYSGTVNISAASTINMRNNNSAVITDTQRNITLSGVLSGAGKLTVDSINTLSTGNPFSGTVTISNAANTWSGDLEINRGTVTFGAAASPAFTNNLSFILGGRTIIQGVNATTLNRTGTLTYAAGSTSEFQADNTSGVLGANYVVNQSGAVTIGSGGTGATVRVFIADVASAVDFSGGVTLGGNTSISVSGGDADSFLTISGIISESLPGHTLTINDDAGAWAQTNTIVRLTGLNTFTGLVTATEGTLDFDTVTNISGAASSLGQGTAISVGAATLRFIGSSSQSTDRPITQTGASTYAANGTSGATITYAGAINAGANNFTLTGLATSGGIISAGITQTGDTVDGTVSSGNWTLSGGTSRIGDVLTVSTGANLSITGGVHAVRNDLIVTGVGTVLNLNVTGGLTFNTPTLSADASLLLRDGAVVNLGANDAVVATEFDRLFIGQDADGATATLNMSTFNLTTSRLILGERPATRTGDINGTGVLTTTGGDIDLYKGTINAGLGSDGAGTFEKFGPGVVTLAGNNTGLTATGATIINEGTLVLSYVTDNNTKLRAASQLDMRGSNLTLNGNAGAATSQTVLSYTLGSGGASTVTLNAAGQDILLSLNAITRAVNAQDGTVRFVLPSGAQTATNGITTDTLNTIGTGANAILGGWATVNDGTGVFFAKNATNAADGNIVAATTTLQNTVGSWVTGQNISDDTGAGFTGTLACANINSLRFNVAAGSDLAMAQGSVLGIASGGILVTSNVGGTPSILNGTLTSGAVATNVPELIITQDSAATFEIGADIRINHALTKSGTGTLLLSGNNVYTGNTEILQGNLQLAGGSAIGDTSLVTLSASRDSTLTLLASETIGRLQGGQRNTNSDYGTVAIGSNTLTINQSANTTYAGFLTGTGTFVMNAGNTGNLNLTNISTGFTGSVVVSGGLFQMSGIGQVNAGSFTINKGGNLLLDNNGTTRSATRILDGASVTLNSADGAFSGATLPRGLEIRTDQNATTSETIGSLNFNSGTNYLTGEASGTTGVAAIIADNFTRSNNSTVTARGRAMGATTGDRNQFRIGTTANETTFTTNQLVGGAGAAATATLSIVPWVVGETVTTATIASTNMGNSLVTYVTGAGFRALDLTTEYATYATAGATNNTRESLAADLTGLATRTVNSLVLNNSNAGPVNINVTGAGAGVSLAVTSGAMLFTRTNPATTATAQLVTLGGFDAGITTAGANPEYIISVVTPDSGDSSKALTATISSPLSSTADITKSGRGTLILSGTNTAGGNTKKTTLNEGVLEIGDLDNIGGNTGGLVFAGGTLRLGAAFADVLSTRTITFLSGGGTLDTNGVDTTLAATLGTGSGSFTKTGAGNLTLNATSARTGATTLTTGTITIGAINALGTTGDITIGGGTTLALSTFSINHGLVTTSGASPAITNGVGGTISASRGFVLNHTGDTTIGAVLAGAGGLFKGQTNIVTLSGLNTYTGTTEVQAGALSFNTIGNVAGGASALGNPSNVENGVIRMGLTTVATTLTYTGTGSTSNRKIAMQGTTGGVTLDADGTGAVVFGSVHGETAGAKTLTLQGASLTAVNNGVGIIDDCAAILSLLKAEANTWELTGSNTYTGATSINEGILRSLAVQNMTAATNALNFGSTNAITTAGTLDLTQNATFTSMLAQTNSAVNTSVLNIAATKTLTITGNVTIGSNAANSTTLFQATGGGNLTVNNPATNGVFAVGGNVATGNKATADLSGLGTLIISLDPATGVVRVNPVNATNVAAKFSVLTLPGTSTITANILAVGDSSQNGDGSVNQLKLGSGVNTVNVNTVNVGTGGRDVGSITFNGGTGSLIVRAADGTSRAAFNVASATANTGVSAGTGNLIDLTGHSADLLLSTLTIGGQNRNTDRTDTFNFDTGTLDATTVVVGAVTTAASATASSNTWTSTLNIGGGTTTIGSGGLDIATRTSAVTGTDILVGNVNVTNGTVTIANSVGLGAAVRLANNTIATGATANGNLNITGGSATVAGNIIKGDSTGAGTATVKIAGGTLDMGGNSIGGAGAANVALVAESGTLKDLAQLNAGGTLTKTTGGTLTMAGTNAYTGATNVSAGTLAVTGSISGTTAVTNSGTLLLNSSTNANNVVGGSIAPTLNNNTVNTTTGTVSATTYTGATGSTLSVGNTVAGGVTNSFASLTLSGSSILDFTAGNGGSNFIFGSLEGSVSLMTGTAYALSQNTTQLQINNWSGSAYGIGATTDNGNFGDTQSRLLFTSDPGFGNGNLISGISFNGFGPGMQVQFGGMYEIVPVPEPATTALIGSVALCALIGYRERRRFTGVRKNSAGK